MKAKRSFIRIFIACSSLVIGTALFPSLALADPPPPPTPTPLPAPAATSLNPEQTPTTDISAPPSPTTTEIPPSGSPSESPPIPNPDPSASPTPTPTPRSAVNALSYNVFGTREGLVGSTTANGRKIADRDHFVALPSRRALGLQVNVCYPKTGKCETTSVQDVGPWNTEDDYWNPGNFRQSFGDLAQGKPEAQAAKDEGYNGGRDGSGRTIANPAGIDLADGTFWDALGMSDNDWVQVTYLWTGGVSTNVNTPQDVLNVRSSASTSASVMMTLGDRTSVVANCQVSGTAVDGPGGSSNVWVRLSVGGYVAATFLDGGPNLSLGGC